MDNLPSTRTPFEVVTISESLVDLCGKLRKRLGLAREDYARFVFKDLMKQTLAATTVNTPAFTVFDPNEFQTFQSDFMARLQKTIGYPCFIKPVNLFGAMETAKVDTQESFLAWKENCFKPQFVYEIEEYIDGTLYHCESVVAKGETVFCQVNEYSRPVHEIYSGFNIGSCSLESNDPIAEEITLLAKRINHYLMPDLSGVTHLEVFRRESSIIFLEIALRPPGILASPFYRQRYGFPITEAHLVIQSNPDWRPNTNPFNHVARVIIPLPKHSGKLSNFHIPEGDCHMTTYWKVKAGQHIGSNDGIDSYAGVLLLWSPARDDLYNSYKRVLDECTLVMEPTHTNI